MHRLVKTITGKKELTARDLGRLQIADLIDVNCGKGLTEEQIKEQFKKFSPFSSIYCREEYGKYMDVEYELRSMRSIYCDKLDKARLACIGLISIYMMALNVDNQFFTTHWIDLVRRSNEIRRGPELWLTLHENFCACAAIKGGFKASGKWLRICKLEDALPNYTLILKDLIQELNQLSKQVKGKLYIMGLIKWIPNMLGLIKLENMEPTEEDILKAKKKLNLDDFAINFDKSIDTMFYDIQDRINYKRMLNEAAK